MAELARPPRVIATTCSTEPAGGGRLPGDADRPPSRRRSARHGDVTAEAHEHPSTDRSSDARRRAVGSKRLGGRTEVEAHAARYADGVIGGVELHVRVAGNGTQSRWRPGGTRQHLVEVGVVAQRSDGVADRRVDRAAGAPRGVDGDVQRFEEQRTHLHAGARVGVQGLELGVRAKPAARQIDLLEVGGQEAGGFVRDVSVLDDDRRGRADGAERPGGQLTEAVLSMGAHRLVPPDVTEGFCELVLGENDDPPLLPVFPLAELPEFPVAELPVLPVLPELPVVPVPPGVDRPEVVELAALFPGCS